MPRDHRRGRHNSTPLPSISLQTEIDPQALGEMLAERCSHQQALSVIKSLDIGMADYDFTLALAKWCVDELKRSSPKDEPFSLSELGF